MLHTLGTVFVCDFLWSIVGVAAAEEPKVQKLTFGSGGVNRSYYRC